MANIGTFKQSKTGYEGTIATLMTNKKVKFVANECIACHLGTTKKTKIARIIS